MRFQRKFRHARNYLPWNSAVSGVEADFMLIQSGDEFLLSQVVCKHERVLARGDEIIPYIRLYARHFDVIRVRK